MLRHFLRLVSALGQADQHQADADEQRTCDVERFQSLAGKRVGLIASPSSIDEHLAPTSELLRDAKNVKLVAMFGPEHGIYGDEYAGDKVGDRRDPKTGIPIYSLYGETRNATSIDGLPGLDY